MSIYLPHKMRETTRLLCEHMPEGPALIAESYIMMEGYPADMATAGHWELVSAMSKEKLDSALYGACRGDSMPLVHHVIALGATDYVFGLLGACCGTNIEACELMLPRVEYSALAENSFECTHAAAAYGGMRTVEWILEHPQLLSDPGLICGAMQSGDMRIVSLVISMGIRDYTEMFYAGRSGDRGIALLALLRGGNPRAGLRGALSCGHINLARWMISHGADNIHDAVRYAIHGCDITDIRKLFAAFPAEAKSAISADVLTSRLDDPDVFAFLLTRVSHPTPKNQ
jgi:hypothetical protein